MKRTVLFYLLLLLTGTVTAQGRFPKHQLGINAFRNPSIGIEYGYRQVSVHAGYYITAFTSGVTTQFVKTGVTYWFLPTDKKPIPSSFYAGASYLRGLNRDYKNIDAFGAEAGFRWMAWRGLNLRIGVIGIAAKGKDLRINPTPGVSYTFSF